MGEVDCTREAEPGSHWMGSLRCLINLDVQQKRRSTDARAGRD